MVKKIKKQENEVYGKFVRIYDDEYVKSIWTYDYSKTKNGPISVELHYKNLPSVKKKK